MLLWWVGRKVASACCAKRARLRLWLAGCCNMASPMASPKASSPNSHRIGTTTPRAKTTLGRCCTPSFLNSSPLRQGGRTFNPSGSPIRYVSGEPDFLSRADHFLNPYKFGDIWAALFAGATSSMLECVSVVERSLLPSTHALLLRAGDSEAFERSEKALFANDRAAPAQSWCGL